MPDSIDKLCSLFAISRDPVIAEKGGKIVFINPAAEKAFEDLAVGLAAEEFIPAALLSLESSDYLSSTHVGKRHAVISCSVLYSMRIYSFIIENADDSGFATQALAGSMRNTLSTLRLATDKLVSTLDLKSDKRLAAYTSALYHNYHLLLHLAENLDTAEGLSRGTLSFQPSSTDICALCRDLVSSMGAIVSKRGIIIDFQCAEDVIRGNVDRLLIERMLMNLISNSVGGLSGGGRVTVSLSSGKDDYTIAVTDNGAGIPPEIFGRIFSLFDVNDFSYSASGRTGLGLYIVRGITELHNGTVIIESKPSSGTCVKVILPMDHGSHTILRTTELEYHASALSSILTELAPHLDYSAYSQRYLED